MTNNEIYEAARKPETGLVARVAYAVWLTIGLGGMIAFAWFAPGSAALLKLLLAKGVSPMILNFVGMPLLMALRAVMLVELIGYSYHRFFEHVGVFTRTAQWFRKSQRFHWMHHMWIYPIGRFYKRAHEYIASEKGIDWSWVIPGILVAGGFVLTNGVNVGSFLFIAFLFLYARYVVDLTHKLFHEVDHFLVNSEYFHWLEDIHVLHHWDQRKNFTIVHPLMDILFGTYMAPKTHREELRIALEDHDITASDLINWRYVLIEATPAERAAFVANAYKHMRSIRKVGKLLKILNERIASHPSDAQAQDLKNKAIALLIELKQDPAQFE
jgi:hypothetical protein